MRRVMSTLVAVGLLSVSAPSLAAYVTVEATKDSGNNYSDFTVVFYDADNNMVLTPGEIYSFTGVDSSIPSAHFDAIKGFSTAGMPSIVAGYSLVGEYSSEGRWVFAGPDVSDTAVLASRWTYSTSVSAVPLPAAAWLLLSGLGGLGFLGRRRKAA